MYQFMTPYALLKLILLSCLFLLISPCLDGSVFAKKKSRVVLNQASGISKFHRKKKRSKSSFSPLKAQAAKYASIVMDADTGMVLHAESADARRFPASCTKMMTLYLTFDALERGLISLDTVMDVSANATMVEPTKLYLREGDTITVKAAILALITKSANDASVVLAEHLSGSVSSFAKKMTKKAQVLGMSKTVFKNPHGLPHPEQATSARDLAILSRALYKNFPQYYKYFSTLHFTHKGVKHRNHNHLLGKVSGVDGIKTGLTNASGYNLAASAVRYDGDNTPRRLITVVMGGPNRHWRDQRVEQLFETYFPRVGIVGMGSAQPLPQEVVRKPDFPTAPEPLTDLIFEVEEGKEPLRIELSNSVTNEMDEDKEEKGEAISSSSDPLGSLLSEADTDNLDEVDSQPFVKPMAIRPPIIRPQARFSKIRAVKAGSRKAPAKRALRKPVLTPAKWVVGTPTSSRGAAKNPKRLGKKRGVPASLVKKTAGRKVVVQNVKQSRKVALSNTAKKRRTI